MLPRDTSEGLGAPGGRSGISASVPETRVAIEKTRRKVQEEETLDDRYAIFKTLLTLAYGLGQYPTFYRTMGGRLKLRFVELPDEAEPTLIFIETYRLTTFPGDYGAGTAVKTFSLLPSEETEISVKTWKKSTQSTEQASSILDSYTQNKADEFEKGVQKEHSDQRKVVKSFSYHAEAEAKASWGWGSAKVSGGVAGSSNSAREQAAKNIMNATESHSQTSSAKRDVNIETSYERTADQGEEQTITRRIKNLNASRTLNFVFRQMNQEFHSLLHLTDIRVAFDNGFPGSMREYSLYELGDMVEAFMNPSTPTGDNTLQDLEGIVMSEYGPDKVFDYQGDPRQLVERITIPATQPGQADYEYLRVIPARKDPSSGIHVGRGKYVMREETEAQQEDVRHLDGVIISARRLTMRTDGVIVESLLGKAPALDLYALDTQQEVVRSRRLENDQHHAGLEIIDKLLGKGEFEEAADAYRNMFVPPAKPEN